MSNNAEARLALGLNPLTNGSQVRTCMLFERGTKPPTLWVRETYKIKETWRVYDSSDNHVFCFLSPLYECSIDSQKAINHVMKEYIGDWPNVSAELITWDNLLRGQECFVLS